LVTALFISIKTLDTPTLHQKSLL